MKYKLNFKLILGAVAIAVLAAGCQPSSSGGSASSTNPTQDVANSSAPTEATQVSEKMPDLNLTDAQKTQMKQIREQAHGKIAALLTPDQQKQFQSAADGNHKSPMRMLRSLNLSADQKQKVDDIMRDQRKQIDAILTPEQQAKMKQHHGHRSNEQSSSN